MQPTSIIQSLPVRPGDTFVPRELSSIDGERVRIPDRTHAFVHLQLRRYAGCPICSLHLRSIEARHAELVSAGIREVVVFHSSAEDIRKVHRGWPFAVVADPRKELYAALGVGTSVRAVLDPRVWPTAVRAVASGASADPTAGAADGSTGLPGDFLVSRDGLVLAAKVGAHADDQWSVDELLALAATEQ